MTMAISACIKQASEHQNKCNIKTTCDFYCMIIFSNRNLSFLFSDVLYLYPDIEHIFNKKISGFILTVHHREIIRGTVASLMNI